VGEGMWLSNDEGVFSELEVGIGEQDRHGCTAADISGDGLPDLYCAIGGERGQGLKTNEMWVQRPTGGVAQEAVERGVADPLGRGRASLFFDADGDGDDDLLITNESARPDGLPSPNRLMRNDGDGQFQPWPAAGLDGDVGGKCARAADYDLDGTIDLAICSWIEQAPNPGGLRLMRGRPSGFVDVTAGMGIQALGEMDALLVDLDADGRADLVQLTGSLLRVSLQRVGRFEVSYERSTSAARALAAGDADGDGRPDLYVVRGWGLSNPPDLMLMNTADGQGFTSITIPQTTLGSGQGVLAIDHDRNGMTDFLVLNGLDEPGPMQLIAFYPG
jgi:hypothetical protein